MSFALKSNSFLNNGLIPSKYTCEGANISPQLSWENFPEGTESFVLIIDDYEAPNGRWNHWLVYNIPSNIQELEEGTKTLPKPAKCGENSWKENRYGGPCPPSGEHHYYFKLFALNTMLELQRKATRLNIDHAIQHHLLGEAVLIGRYSLSGAKKTKNDTKDIEDAITIMSKKDVNHYIKDRAYKEVEKDAFGN